MAVVIAAALVAIVACDLTLVGFRDWWNRHSVTSSIVASLLVLGVTALIVDEVLARRQRRERATSVAVQSLIVYAQALRAYETISNLGGEGADTGTVVDEMTSLAGMILTASPNLFDDPQARAFLEDIQQLAGSMFRVTRSIRTAGAVPAERQAALDAAMFAVKTTGAPLLARLPPEYRTTAEEGS